MDAARARSAEVAAWAEGLPPAVLACRELLHAWRPAAAQLCLDGGWERVLVCTRCRTRKRQLLDPHGRLSGNPRSDYPEDYLDREHSPGRLDSDDRATLRLTALTRAGRKGERER